MVASQQPGTLSSERKGCFGGSGGSTSPGTGGTSGGAFRSPSGPSFGQGQQLQPPFNMFSPSGVGSLANFGGSRAVFKFGGGVDNSASVASCRTPGFLSPSGIPPLPSPPSIGGSSVEFKFGDGLDNSASMSSRIHPGMLSPHGIPPAPPPLGQLPVVAKHVVPARSWVAWVHPDNGRFYFENAVTKAVAWEVGDGDHCDISEQLLQQQRQVLAQLAAKPEKIIESRGLFGNSAGAALAGSSVAVVSGIQPALQSASLVGTSTIPLDSMSGKGACTNVQTLPSSSLRDTVQPSLSAGVVNAAAQHNSPVAIGPSSVVRGPVMGVRGHPSMAGAADSGKLHELKDGIMGEIHRLQAEPEYSIGQQVLYVDQEQTARCSVVGHYYNGTTAVYQLIAVGGSGACVGGVFESLIQSINIVPGGDVLPHSGCSVGGASPGKGTIGSVSGGSSSSTVIKVSESMDWCDIEEELVGSQTQRVLEEQLALADQHIALRDTGTRFSLSPGTGCVAVTALAGIGASPGATKSDSLSGGHVDLTPPEPPGVGEVSQAGVTSTVTLGTKRAIECRDWVSLKRSMAVLTQDVALVHSNVLYHAQAVIHAAQALDGIKEKVLACHNVLKLATNFDPV